MQTTEQLTDEQARQMWEQMDQEDKGGKPAEDLNEAAPQGAGAAQAAPADEGAAAEEDPYAGMTAFQKSLMIGLKEQNEQLQQRVRKVEGHIGGLKSQLSAQQAPAAAAPGAATPSAAQLQQATSSPAAMEALKADYPEFAEAIESAIGQTAAQLREELGRQQSQPAGLTPEDVSAAIVEFAHPGWKAEVAKPEFVGWLRQQPVEVQQLAASDLAADAVKLLDAYKTPDPAAAQRNRRLESQAGMPTGRTTATRGKSVDDMTAEEYWAYLDKQESKGK